MKNRIWRGFGLIVTVSALALGGHLVLSLYASLPASAQIFRWQHTHVQHLAFHLDRYGYQAGDTVSVYASVAPAAVCTLHLYDIMRRDTLQTSVFPGSFQPLADSASMYGTGWHPTSQLVIPKDASTGWYVVEIRTKQQVSRSSLFIQPAHGQVRKRIAWLLSTNTWNAYNSWGGYSLYTHPLNPRVSFLRPQPLADPSLHATLAHHQWYFQGANQDRHLAVLLDSLDQGYDVYDMMALQAGDKRLEQYDLLLISTHSEYWSHEMLSHLNQLLDSGLSLINLAGNVAAYRSYLDPKSASLTVHKHPKELWPVLDSAQLRPFGTGMYLMGFHTYAPFEVMVDSSWLLAGTGLTKGDMFGQKSLSYDYTHMYDNVWERLWGLTQWGQLGAASGLEIDKVYEGTPANWQTVASGLNPPIEGHGEVYPSDKLDWSAGSGADLGYYWHPGGGLVMAASSMTFTGAIPLDPQLQQIVHNAIKRALPPRTAGGFDSE